MRHYQGINLYRNLILCILVSFDMLYGISMREQNEKKSPMEVSAILVKAFTKNPDEGNPAGVILNADRLSTYQMQYAAAQLGFSESVFVSESKQAEYRFRYFTPICEVDACAHATIAALHVLAEKRVSSYETNKGTHQVETKFDGEIVITQEKPTIGDKVSKRGIAKLFGISHKKISIEWPCMVVSTGVPKLIVPIVDLKTLLEIKPNLEEIRSYCFYKPCKGVYLFTTETIGEHSDAHTRQFNPLYGIDEDPVTGTAAGALGAYFSYMRMVEPYYDIEQGNCMGKPGMVRVYTSPYTNVPVKIAGYAVIYGERVLTV